MPHRTPNAPRPGPRSCRSAEKAKCWARFRRGTPVLLLAAVLAGCRGRDGPELRPDARLPLPANTPATGLHVQGEQLWLTAPGTVLPGDTAGRFAGRAATLAIDADPNVLGAGRDRVYVRAARQLLAVEPRSGRVAAARAGTGANRTVLDPLGRFLFVATPSGAVLGLDPETLETAWAWPRLGRRITAAALSPQGDRLYTALAAGETGGADLLARDAQTGRVMGEQPLPWPLHALESMGNGVLVGVGGDKGEANMLVALRPRRGAAEVVWRRSAANLGLEPPLRLRADPAGKRLAVFGSGKQRLRVLDAQTGRTLGTIRPAPAEAAFGGAGALYTLAEGEVRVYR